MTEDSSRGDEVAAAMAARDTLIAAASNDSAGLELALAGLPEHVLRAVAIALARSQLQVGRVCGLTDEGVVAVFDGATSRITRDAIDRGVEDLLDGP